RHRVDDEVGVDRVTVAGRQVRRLRGRAVHVEVVCVTEDRGFGTGDRGLAGAAVDDAVAPASVDDVVPVARRVDRADLVLLAVRRVRRVPVRDAGGRAGRRIPVVRVELGDVLQRAVDVDHRLL